MSACFYLFTHSWIHRVTSRLTAPNESLRFPLEYTTLSPIELFYSLQPSGIFQPCRMPQSSKLKRTNKDQHLVTLFFHFACFRISIVRLAQAGVTHSSLFRPQQIIQSSEYMCMPHVLNFLCSIKGGRGHKFSATSSGIKGRLVSKYKGTS